MQGERGDCHDTCYSYGRGSIAVDGAGETDGDRGKRWQRWRDDKDLQGDERMILSDNWFVRRRESNTYFP